MSDGLLWSRSERGLHFRLLDELVADRLPPESIQYAVARRSSRLVLRGAAVRLDGQNLLLAGPSGAGASTIAAAAIRGDALLIADGALSIELPGGVVRVARRNAPIGLWADVLDLLDLDGLRRIAPDVPKYRWDATIVDQPLLRVDAILVVDPTSTDPTVRQVEGAAAAAAVGQARAIVSAEPRTSMDGVVETITAVRRVGVIGGVRTDPLEVVERCRRWLSIPSPL